MKYVKGDLIELAKRGDFDVIAHGCNCFCTMGAGVALAIARAFPEAAAVDAATVPGDVNKLGTITRCTVKLENGKLLDIANCYTQYRFGPGAKHLSYQALQDCMLELTQIYAGMRVGLPKIGSGLAGGDWDKIEEILELTSDAYCIVTIVELP